MELRELNHGNLPDLLEASVAGTDPLEVMPPVDGPPGWNDERRQAFLDFHRARSLDAPEPVETTYVVEVDGRVVGAARLEPQPEGVEVGLWLARGHRGLGIGGEVLEALAVVARSQGTPGSSPPPPPRTPPPAASSTGRARSRRPWRRASQPWST